MKAKKLLALAAAILAAGAVCSAQTKYSQVIENGGTGEYKAVAIGDESLPTHVIYRPQNLRAYVSENGKIPVLLYANSACANNSLEMSRLLTEVASHGYLVIAIGPYQEMSDEDFYAQWRGVVRGNYPESKVNAVMGNGERLTPYTEAERAQQAAEREAARQAAARNNRNNRNAHMQGSSWRLLTGLRTRTETMPASTTISLTLRKLRQWDSPAAEPRCWPLHTTPVSRPA